MAKRNNPKLYQIKWRKEDVTNLQKAVRDFNKNVKKLKKARKDTEFIPDEISYRNTKALIGNRAEYNRILKSLSRFKGSKAFKKVTLPSGKEISAWEKREIGYQKGVAKRRIKSLMEEEKRHYRRKTERYKELEWTLKSVEDVFNRKGKSFEIAKQRIENYGSQDFEIRTAIIYKENYLSMLGKRFRDLEGYKELIREIKRTNPISLYETLKLMEQGEKIKDISYMYDTSDYQNAFNLLRQAFGLEVEEDEEFEFDEEGE